MSHKTSTQYAILVAGAFIALCSSTALAGTTTYTYDTQGRVIQVAYSNGTVVTYAYDKAGNRTQVTKTP